MNLASSMTLLLPLLERIIAHAQICWAELSLFRLCLCHNHFSYVLAGKLSFLILLLHGNTIAARLATFSAIRVLSIQLHWRIGMNARASAASYLESLGLLKIVGRIVTVDCKEALRVASSRHHTIHEIFLCQICLFRQIISQADAA